MNIPIIIVALFCALNSVLIIILEARVAKVEKFIDKVLLLMKLKELQDVGNKMEKDGESF